MYNKPAIKTSFMPGLNSKQATELLTTYGSNELIKKKKQPLILKILSYFKNPLIVILLIAAVISYFSDEFKSAFIIFAMVILSVALNFFQEHKSSKAAEKISNQLASRATAIRDDKEIEIDVKNLVPGDIVILSAGDIIPADGKLIFSDDLFVNESVLTGESFPVEKNPEDEKNSRLFSGSNITSGYGRMLVETTGLKTEYGKIAAKLSSKEDKNAFEIGLEKFGYLILKVIIVIVSLIFLINAFLHKDLVDSLIFSIAVAVGVIPELLPMIMSVNMARGSIKMAKKGVIVKRLNSIPDFGSMDVLCTDKTGTLTQDKITLVKYLDYDGETSEKVLRLAYINSSFEKGLKSLLDKAVLDFKVLDINSLKRVDEIPYDFRRKKSSVIFDDNGQRYLSSKGAPEEIIKACSTYDEKGVEKSLDKKAIENIQKIYDSLSANGFRVLAVAHKKVSTIKDNYLPDEEIGLSLSGFMAFYDPPKESAKETLVFMAEHGVEIKILTGDSTLVTKKVCDDLGLKVKGIISGDEFDFTESNYKELLEKVRSNTIFGRFSPDQKEKVIELLKRSGSVVGYLGDGINDAPSLKKADVGISVDNAVDVAKETADIILMEKGLQELMEGVIEGRKTFGNTMKYIMMGSSSNFGNMFSMMGASIFLPFFPMLPGQILLNNFLYDTSQLAIPSDNVDPEYLKKPKHWDISFVKKFMLVFGPVSSLFDFLTFFVLYKVFSLSGGAFQAAWFVESLATQVFVVYIIRTKKLPFFQSRPSIYLLLSTIGIVALGALITLSPLASLLDFVAPGWPIFGSIAVIVILYLIVTESLKQIFYKRLAAKHQGV